MTKREICEKLIKTRDLLQRMSQELCDDKYYNFPVNDKEIWDASDFLRDLLLEVTVPVDEKEEEKKEEPMPTEKKEEEELFSKIDSIGVTLCNGSVPRENKELPLGVTLDDQAPPKQCPICGRLSPKRFELDGCYWCIGCNRGFYSRPVGEDKE